MFDLDLMDNLMKMISEEHFKIILNARKEALANMKNVGVTVPTELHLLGTRVWLALDFDYSDIAQRERNKGE